jgi:hypothetical protein
MKKNAQDVYYVSPTAVLMPSSKRQKNAASMRINVLSVIFV